MQNKNELIKNVEQQVCDFFALPIEDVFSKNTKRDLTLARHFVIYILHKDFGLSNNELAKRHNCSWRNICYICSNINSYLKYDKKYKNYYKCLLQYINKRE